MRGDLLTLTVDDLERLSNRGIVKRARRDLDEGRLRITVETDGDEVVMAWAGDGEGRCTFPAGKTARDGRCTCVSTGMCRHRVAALMAYAERDQGAVATSWDPGEIPDETLQALWKRRRAVDPGLVEVARAARPTAWFHHTGCVVRFLVPGDPRYTACTCKEADPCEHVPLAVEAFRRLPAGVSAGFVSAGEAAPVDPALLAEAEGVLAELAEHGLSSLSSLWRDRVTRLERALRAAGLVWPAEIAAELAAEFERYATHDALFSPERLVDLAGEMLIRCDAIAAAPTEVPALFVRGGAADRETPAAKDVYTGLGVGVRQLRRGVELTAYMQEGGSGMVVAVTRAFADPEDREPLPFAEVAQAYAGGAPLADLGRGQVVLQGGRRRADRSFVMPRKTGGVLPQAWRWEKLQPPVRVEAFADLRERLGRLPPASLRPRRVGEDLHVLAVAEVEAAVFDPRLQAVRLLVRDADGDTAEVVHPFASRAAEGTEALLAALREEVRLCFVSGRVSLAAGALRVAPLAFVFERDGVRRAVVPWIDRCAESVWAPSEGTVGTGDPLLDLLRDMGERLGEVLLLGAGHADARTLRLWRDLMVRLERAGSSRLRDRVTDVVAQMERRLSTVGWSAAAASAAVLRLCALARLAQDLQV